MKEIATQKGWTQTKLSRVADIFHNPYKDVAYSTLLKIAKVLNVDVTELTEEVPDEEQ